MVKNDIKNKFNISEKGLLFLLYIFIYSILLEFHFCYILLPFKEQSIQPSNNITEIISNMIDNKLLVTIPMGEPEKEIDLFISMNEYFYYLEEGSCPKNSKSTYFPFNSSKFVLEEKEDISFSFSKKNNCSIFSDTLFIYQDSLIKDKKPINEFKYFYCTVNNPNVQNSSKICGTFGLQLENENYLYYKLDNLLTSLKQLKIIQSFSWTIYYFPESSILKKNYDGALILDIYDKKFFENFSLVDNYLYDYAISRRKIISWILNIDKAIYYVNGTIKTIRSDNQAALSIEVDGIIAPQVYLSLIKEDYFKFYINNKVCTFNDDKNFKYFYCNKELFKKYNYENYFPSLNFFVLNLNKTFTLTGKDLFKDVGDVVIFMIFYKTWKENIWVLGKVFLNKYNFIFDNDKKTVGYTQKLEKKEMPKEEINESFFGKYKWWCLFIILAVIVGVLIGKTIREKTRKPRANELDDNFEYFPGSDKNYKEKGINNIIE